MDIDLNALREAYPDFGAAETMAANLGLTQIRVRRWRRRVGGTLHVVFHEPGQSQTVTWKLTVCAKRQRRKARV